MEHQEMVINIQMIWTMWKFPLRDKDGRISKLVQLASFEAQT